ncbi:MAG: hypothetical protein JWO73_574 [Candidatus Taylorbacteria bacterium]|nr:hypothetical protein [Candidatus Taylorbacteria bacterium]
MDPLPEIKLGTYRHYKGNEYEVIGVGRNSETNEPVVVYRAMYDSEEFGSDAIWIRPASMFAENVFVNGKEMPRFEFLRK